MAKTNVRGGQIADGANGVDLTVDVTGTLPVGNGGTGLTSVGAAGTVLTSNGASASWSASGSTADDLITRTLFR